MAYTLQAILGYEAEMLKADPKGLPTVKLADGFALWPIDSDYQEAHAIPFLPLTDEGHAGVPLPVVALTARLSVCTYIEAEYFGGDGGQVSVLYRNGVQEGSLSVSDSAINEALRYIGFIAKSPLDEFDSVGLSRERSTDNWRKNQTAEHIAPDR